jgi:RNA polymerase sigma factor (sigma-70 family)
LSENEIDIRLLRENPRELLLRYQPLIRLIVKSLAYKGYLPKRDIPDLVQDVNRKLVERLERIRDQYNYKSRFKTYFSVVVRNLCMEEFRKLRVITEPQPEIYEHTASEEATDQLMIRQEFERLQRAVRLFYRDEQAIWLTMRVLADIGIDAADLARFEKDPGLVIRRQLARQLNATFRHSRKEKLRELSLALSQLDERNRTPDAIRKWFTSRLDEILELMNGNPPRSAYTLDILLILIEKIESEKNIP